MRQLYLSFLKFYYFITAQNRMHLSYEDMKDIQMKKLKKMLVYVYENIPFYKDFYDEHNVDVYSINTEEDMLSVPYIEKQHIQENLDKFILPGTDLDKCVVQRTTGSSGKPMKIYYGVHDDCFSKAINMRSFVQNGFNPASKWIFIQDPIWSSKRYSIGKKFWFQKYLKLFNPMDISVHLPVEEQVQIMLDHGCDCLHGYPSSLYIIAEYIKKNDIKDIRPSLVVTTGELITEEIRNYLNDVFQTELVDFVATTEFNRILWECSRHEGYHIDIDSVYMEIINNGKHVEAGEEGEIVITGLYNKTTPLVRYRTKDVGAFSEKQCSCGRPLPLLKSFKGRADDFIIDKDNRMYSPMSVWSVVRHSESIKDFIVIQEDFENVIFRVIKKENADGNDIEKTCKELQAVFGENLKVTLEYVDNIEKRKLRSVQSKVVTDRFKV